MDVFPLLARITFLGWLVLRKVGLSQGHEGLQAVLAIIAVWAIFFFGILSDSTHFPYPFNYQLIISITIALSVFSGYYFYWKSGHPLVRALRTTGTYIASFAELSLSAILLYESAIYAHVIYVVLNPSLVGNFYSYVVLVGILVAVVGLAFAIGVILGYDAVSRATGRGGKPITVNLPRTRGRVAVTVLHCSNPACRARYPVDVWAVGDKCRYCGHATTADVEML